MLETPSPRQSGIQDAQTLLDSMPLLAWSADSGGLFQYFNDAWLDYTGQTLSKAIKWGFRSTLHPDDIQPTLEAWDECVRSGRDFEHECQLRRASDGDYRWHLCRATARKDSRGNVLSWIGTSTDITDLKRQHRDTVGMLEQAMDSASRQQTFLREVLASLSEGGLILCDSIVDLPPMKGQLLRGVRLSADTFGHLRRDMREIAEDLGFSQDRTLDMLTALGEAAMNALLYCGGGTVRVHTDDTRTLQIWIEDAGPTACPLSRSRITAAGEGDASYIPTRGHGFLMMAKMVDRVWLLVEQDGATIVMEQAWVDHEPVSCESGPSR